MGAGRQRAAAREAARAGDFCDAEAFGANVPPASGRVSFLQVAGRRSFSGRIHQVSLHDATVVLGELEVATLSRGAVDPGRIVVLSPLRAAEPCVWNGHRVKPGDLLALGPGAEHYGANPRGMHFALVSIHAGAFEASCAALTGREAEIRRGEARILRPPAGVARNLRAGLSRIAHIAGSAASQRAMRAALRAAERSLIVELTRRFEAADTPLRRERLRVDRAAVLRRVGAYLDVHLDHPVYLRDLCAAARVGERTLEIVFRESYGLTPVRYLKLRRLEGTRRALTRTEHGNVTDVALEFGFWHLGHFAADYKALFGEAPSQTLRRSVR